MAVPPYLEERKNHPTCRRAGKARTSSSHGCHIPDSVASLGKYDGRPPGQTGAIPGHYSGRVALRYEQCNRELYTFAIHSAYLVPLHIAVQKHNFIFGTV